MCVAIRSSSGEEDTIARFDRTEAIDGQQIEESVGGTTNLVAADLSLTRSFSRRLNQPNHHFHRTKHHCRLLRCPNLRQQGNMGALKDLAMTIFTISFFFVRLMATLIEVGFRKFLVGLIEMEVLLRRGFRSGL